MIKILAFPLGKLLLLFKNMIGDYVLALLLLIVVIKAVGCIFDFYSRKMAIKNQALAPYIKKLNNEYSNQPSVYENTLLNLYKAAKYSTGISIASGLINTLIFICLFTVLYAPISFYFNVTGDQLTALKESVVTLVPEANPASEISILNAIRDNLNLFPKLPITNEIAKTNFMLFNLDIIRPIPISSPYILLPIVTVGFFVTNLIKSFLKLKTSNGIKTSQVISLTFSTLIVISISLSAIFFPAIYFIYIIFSMVTSKLVGMVFKKMLNPFEKRFNDNFKISADKIIESLPAIVETNEIEQ